MAGYAAAVQSQPPVAGSVEQEARQDALAGLGLNLRRSFLPEAESPDEEEDIRQAADAAKGNAGLQARHACRVVD